MGWAVVNWGRLEGKAIRDGVLSPRGPTSLLDLPPRMFLAYVESLLREDEEADEILERLYARARPVNKDDRAREIRAAMAAFS